MRQVDQQALAELASNGTLDEVCEMLLERYTKTWRAEQDRERRDALWHQANGVAELKRQVRIIAGAEQA